MAAELPKSEVLIPEYFEKMLEIAYEMMIDLYNSSAINEDREDKRQWIIEELDEIYKRIYQEKFLIDVFGAQDKVTKEIFIAQFEKDDSKYLKSVELRKMVFHRVMAVVFENNPTKIE